jgi:hypothetical protein
MTAIAQNQQLLITVTKRIDIMLCHEVIIENM